MLVHTTWCGIIYSVFMELDQLSTLKLFCHLSDMLMMVIISFNMLFVYCCCHISTSDFVQHISSTHILLLIVKWLSTRVMWKIDRPILKVKWKGEPIDRESTDIRESEDGSLQLRAITWNLTKGIKTWSQFFFSPWIVFTLPLYEEQGIRFQDSRNHCSAKSPWLC